MQPAACTSGIQLSPLPSVSLSPHTSSSHLHVHASAGHTLYITEIEVKKKLNQFIKNLGSKSSNIEWCQ